MQVYLLLELITAGRGGSKKQSADIQIRIQENLKIDVRHQSICTDPNEGVRLWKSIDVKDLSDLQAHCKKW